MNIETRDKREEKRLEMGEGRATSKLGRSLKESHVRFDDYIDLSETSLRKSCQRVMSHLYSQTMNQEFNHRNQYNSKQTTQVSFTDANSQAQNDPLKQRSDLKANDIDFGPQAEFEASDLGENYSNCWRQSEQLAKKSFSQLRIERRQFKEKLVQATRAGKSNSNDKESDDLNWSCRRQSISSENFLETNDLNANSTYVATLNSASSKWRWPISFVDGEGSNERDSQVALMPGSKLHVNCSNPVASSHELSRRRFFQRLEQIGAASSSSSGKNADRSHDQTKSKVAPTEHIGDGAIAISDGNQLISLLGAHFCSWPRKQMESLQKKHLEGSNSSDHSNKYKGFSLPAHASPFEIQVPRANQSNASSRLVVKQLKCQQTQLFTSNQAKPRKCDNEPPNETNNVDSNNNGPLELPPIKLGGRERQQRSCSCPNLAASKEPERSENCTFEVKVANSSCPLSELTKPQSESKPKWLHEDDGGQSSCSSSGFGASSESSAPTFSIAQVANSNPTTLTPNSIFIENLNYAPLPLQPAYANLVQMKPNLQQQSHQAPIYATLNRKNNKSELAKQDENDPRGSKSSLDSAGFSSFTPIKSPEASGTRIEQQKAKSSNNSILRKFSWLVSRALKSNMSQGDKATHLQDTQTNHIQKLSIAQLEKQSANVNQLQQADLVILPASEFRRRRVANRIRLLDSGQKESNLRRSEDKSRRFWSSCCSWTSSESVISELNGPARARFIQIDCPNKSTRSARARHQHKSSGKSRSSKPTNRGRCKSRRRHKCNCEQKGRLLSLDSSDGSQLVQLERACDHKWNFSVAPGSLGGIHGVFVSRLSSQSLSALLAVGDRILALDGRRVVGEPDAQWLCERLQRSSRVQLRLAPLNQRSNT